MLQGMHFGIDHPMFMNYGGLGIDLAHEVTEAYELMVCKRLLTLKDVIAVDTDNSILITTVW